MTTYLADTLDLPVLTPEKPALLASENGWLKQAFQKEQYAGRRRDLSDALLSQRLSISIRNCSGNAAEGHQHHRCSVVDLNDETSVEVAARIVSQSMAPCDLSRTHLELALLQAMLPVKDRFAVLVTNDKFKFDAGEQDIMPGIAIASRRLTRTTSRVDPASHEYELDISAIEAVSSTALPMLAQLVGFQMFEDLRQMRRSGEVRSLRIKITLPKKHFKNSTISRAVLNQVERFEIEAKMLKASMFVDDVILTPPA